MTRVAQIPRSSVRSALLMEPAIGIVFEQSAQQQLPLQLLAADMFDKTFLAGISIALAGVVSTVFIGIIVRGRYDSLEQSFFDTQDEERERAATVEPVDADVASFYGNLSPELTTAPQKVEPLSKQTEQDRVSPMS
eukprot:CAMPEP_0119313254 /NCGR_PEP_ID=MMETSP1333-20130426/28499_1 /TAXON_ID=418940 /ORGANISM="Scyphosphaera apsteinii, Strain RCC1455" /LENGTH=135 /DNA_ID=CAMNT_0007318053 /DNA_START=93 /DNA_END=500 /DNA_ORIENTATION=+